MNDLKLDENEVEIDNFHSETINDKPAPKTKKKPDPVYFYGIVKVITNQKYGIETEEDDVGFVEIVADKKSELFEKLQKLDKQYVSIEVLGIYRGRRITLKTKTAYSI